MTILHQKKVILEKGVTTRKNPDSISEIYLTAAKAAQCRLVAEDRIKKEESKKETAKKISDQKLCLQQKRSEAFQKCQDSMYSLSSSPSEESMFVELVNLSSNTLKDVFAHLGGRRR